MSDAAAKAADAIVYESRGRTDNVERFAQIIRAEYAELVDAAAEFTDYYKPVIQGRLGNGRAYKSCDRIRAALKKVSP